MPFTPGRRSFMSTLASLAGLAALDASVDAASAQTPPPTSAKWDLAWIDEFKGRHKQVFDYGWFPLGRDPRALRFVRNYLDAHQDVYGLSSPQINSVVGVAFEAFPMNASDAIWEKYKLGERWKIDDPKTKQPATRNIYLEDGPGAPGVKTLQGRGTTFWQCNVALGAAVTRLAEATGTPPATVRAELIDGLNPGVRLVPAHVMLVGLMQERGFTYVRL